MFDQMLSDKPGRHILEHRLAMAAHLGRMLEPGEVVHHKNGKRDDNRIENLRLYVSSKHHAGFGDFYQEWQEALRKISELEARVKS
jgi:hypothetical protein